MPDAWCRSPQAGWNPERVGWFLRACVSLPWQPEFDMRNALVIALVALLLQPVGAQDAKDSVVGLWLGETRTQGGLGNWIDFHPDGTVEVGFGALVGALLDDTYRLVS
jgi:hypothetical protein